jgi:hypothetical protein
MLKLKQFSYQGGQNFQTWVPMSPVRQLTLPLTDIQTNDIGFRTWKQPRNIGVLWGIHCVQIDRV